MANRFGVWCVACGLLGGCLALPCLAANPDKDDNEPTVGGRARASKFDKDATEEEKDPSPDPDTPSESREETVLRNKIEKALAKGKGDIYVLGVSETTFHTDVERKYVKNVKVNGRLMQDEVTEIKTAGEYYPVPSVQFQAIEGEDAAVAFVMDHMKKFPPVPKKKTRKKDKQIDAGPPPPVGDWTFVGRFSDATKAEASLKQAQEKFDALPNWKASEKKGGE